VGIASDIAAKQKLLSAEAQTPTTSQEIKVTIAVPEDVTLSGTAIITLEDITLLDTSAVELARVVVPASDLEKPNATIAVSVDLRLVKPDATVNVAVLIDVDNSGDLSVGDWISDSLATVINNSKMAVIIGVVRIGGD